MCKSFSKKIFSIIALNLLIATSIKPEAKEPPTINKIIINGNKHVKREVILNAMPYKVHQKFDKQKSGATIKNIYALGYFNQVQLKQEKLPDNKVNLIVDLEEEKLLEQFNFVGNKQIKSDKIAEELRLAKLTTIDEEKAQRIAQAIKKMYTKDGYHNVEIKTEITPNEENPDKAKATFYIREGKKATISRVKFIGNKSIQDRKLRGFIATRENWILKFMDGAGEFDEDNLEMDKHRIEYFYKDQGYLMATVAKADAEFSKSGKHINVTFHIKEGDVFTINSIHAIGDEFYTEKEILEHVTLEEGKPYSQSKLIETLNNLKALWGEKGYIYADVYPQIKPNEETNEVEITFHIEKGKKLYVNRINITGNTFTRDKVIRRQFEIEEGDLITSKKLAQSQNNVEYLSFFQRGGVNWKVHRISDELADLEMNVHEAKTGNFQLGLKYGSDKYNPQPSLRGSISIDKKNLFGMGWDTAFMIEANRHAIPKTEIHFFDPSIFDTNVSGAFSFYRRWQEYTQWRSTNKTPKETVLGGEVRLGFGLPKIDKRLRLILDIGVENIDNNDPVAIGPNRDLLEPIVRRSFQNGTLTWFGLDLVKDTRNHQVYPNKGYKFSLGAKTAPPFLNSEFSFFKFEMEASHYSELIDDDWLVLALHGKIGTIRSMGGEDHKTKKSKIIPYKELFHMGGQNTVRGFTWGGIGPAWITNDPLGGRHALLFNAELIFPLIPDYSMKGHVFYDAGAGWSTPKDDIQEEKYIKRDKFNLRHSVGFGLNLTKPVPAKIDWGYKLDRDKKAGESPHEFHLSMNYAW